MNPSVVPRRCDAHHPSIARAGAWLSSRSITIRRLVVSAGKVTSLAATFTQHGEGGHPALRGTLDYVAPSCVQAAQPPSRSTTSAKPVAFSIDAAASDR